MKNLADETVLKLILFIIGMFLIVPKIVSAGTDFTKTTKTLVIIETDDLIALLRKAEHHGMTDEDRARELQHALDVLYAKGATVFCSSEIINE